MSTSLMISNLSNSLPLFLREEVSQLLLLLVQISTSLMTRTLPNSLSPTYVKIVELLNLVPVAARQLSTSLTTCNLPP